MAGKIQSKSLSPASKNVRYGHKCLPSSGDAMEKKYGRAEARVMEVSKAAAAPSPLLLVCFFDR